MLLLVKNVSSSSEKEIFWGNAPDVINFLCGLSFLNPSCDSCHLDFSFTPDLDDDSSYDVIVYVFSDSPLN